MARGKVQGKVNVWKEKLRPYYFRMFAAALVVLALMFIFGRSFKFALVVSGLTALASLSTFYQNFFKSPVNFELIKFSTVLASAAYGVVTGLAVGIISTIASKIISERLDQTSFPSLIGIVVVAVAASMFSSVDIVLLGMAMVVLYHAITAPIQMALGGTFAYGAVYVGSNLAFNFIIFSRLAPLIAGIM